VETPSRQQQAGGQIKGLVNIATCWVSADRRWWQNASGGTTTIVNAGDVDMSIFGAGLLTTADAASVVTYGGAQTN
jgi:hypothetical protein